MADTPSIAAKTPILEWIAAGLGLIFLVALLFVVGRDALTRPSGEPAAVSIVRGKTVRTTGGYVMTFEARNGAGGDAAELQVEGQLLDRDRVVETSSAVIDYVPGSGRAEGGLYFERDPAGLTVRLRPLGYQAP